MYEDWNAPKTKQINIRLTKCEYDWLKEASNSSKMSISHWIRAVLHEIFEYESEESG